MITLEKFYDLISRNAQVTLVSTRNRTNIYTGSARDIPLEYSDCTVEDFSMGNNGNLTFRVKTKTKRYAGNEWQEGSLRVGSSIYHYWVKQHTEGSEYGIDGGRVLKMMLKRKNEIVCNYDRGWDVKPVDNETELAKDIILHQYTV